MAPGGETLHDVIVLWVGAAGDVILVDVYGSDVNLCGTVRFTFRGARERRRVTRLIERWARDATPLTFVRTSSSVALRAPGSDRVDAAC